MKNQSIRVKLQGAFVLMLITISLMSIYIFNHMETYTAEVSKQNELTNRMEDLSLKATVQFKKQVQEWKNMLIRGHKQKDYDKYSAQFESMRVKTQETVKELRELAKDYPEIRKVADEFLIEHDKLTEKYYGAIPLLFKNPTGLGYRDVDVKVRGIDRAPTDLIQSAAVLAEKIKEETLVETQADIRQFKKDMLLMAVIAFLVMSLAYIALIEFSVLKPIRALTGMVKRISSGDYGARSGFSSKDEIGIFASNFDALLDERAEKLAIAEEERAALNNSVVGLLQSVAQLSQKDLTVHVPVSEDITGTLSDAINLLAKETALTLKDVNQVSERVNTSSTQVKNQADAVMDFAAQEREETEKMLRDLNVVAQTMLKVAKISQITNESSQNAMTATDVALDAVTETVNSINKIREIIREIEKRIKRLGERSQEITAAVNIINEISERTHVLALNAGMQAAQAGEAGRGFMVVANEVQRLAESSREATGQISQLVKNIQVDTSDAVNTMNDVIKQVVEGTQLAQEAGNKMQDTRTVTIKLVEYVHQIAEYAKKQVALGQVLKNRTTSIQLSTEKTHTELQAQSKLSLGLVSDAEMLLEKVRVFKLPA